MMKWPWSRKEETTLDLLTMVLDIMEGSYVPLEAHTARVKELLDASNINMELRRKAEQAVRDAERDTMRAVRFARQNLGAVRSIDWLSGQVGNRKTRIEGDIYHVLNLVRAFVAGFSGETDSIHFDREAFEAGKAAKRSDHALSSAAKSVGITNIG